MYVREPTPAERERVEKYLLLDQEQLLSLIPAYLPEYDSYRFSPVGQSEAGRSWFERIRGSLEQTICGELAMCKRISDPNFSDTAALVIVVGDAIAVQTTVVPPVLVATIVARIGIRKFCNCP